MHGFFYISDDFFFKTYFFKARSRMHMGGEQRKGGREVDSMLSVEPHEELDPKTLRSDLSI